MTLADIVDGATACQLRERGLELRDILDNNYAYNGLAAVGDLIKTGPASTNVNDVKVVLCK